MGAVGALVPEVVEEGDDMRLARVRLRRREGRVRVVGRGVRGWIGGRDEPLEELDLVEGCLCIAGGGFDDFEGDMTVQSGRRSGGESGEVVQELTSRP